MIHSDKTQVVTTRSSFVTVLAWVFIILSGLATLVSLAQNIILNFFVPFDQIQQSVNSVPEGQDMPVMVGFMANHFRWFFGTFFVLSAATFVSSIALLKRKNWARIFFVFLMGFAIVWNIGGLILQQFIYASMPSLPPTAPPEIQSQFKSIQTVMSIFSYVMALGFSLLFAWVIKRLISPGIKREFEA